jgi:hypothetical protein
MAPKVTFDAENHEIVVTLAPTNGVVTLDFQVDIYSDGKEDWIADNDLAKHAFPITAEGGRATPGGKTIDPVFFLEFPWKIRPYDASHELVINGNFYTSDGSQAVLDRPGRTITARVNSTFSAGTSGSSTAPTVDEIWDDPRALTPDDVWNDSRALTFGKFIGLK